MKDVNGNTTAVGYDTAGRVRWMRDSRSRTVTTYEYGRDGMTSAVTDPLGRTVRYAYDAAGDRTEVSDALGKYDDVRRGR